LDLPTLYNLNADVSSARIFAITPGGAVSGIDFVMMDNSIRSVSAFGQTAPAPPSFTIQIHVRLEDSAKIPVFASGDFTSVRFTDTITGVQKTQQIRSSFSVSLSTSSRVQEYRVSVENLPAGMVVKSMTYGSSDVLAYTLKIPTTKTTILPARPTVPELTITLATVPGPSLDGVRVTGRAKDTEVRAIYLSGNPGTFFSDGTFEFRGVAPGRYSIAAPGSSPVSSLGASIVVGDRDMDGVEIEAIAVLPNDAKQPRPPDTTGTHAPGTVLPLAAFRGRIVEEASGVPIEEGTIRLIGRNSITVPIGVGGEFQFTRLLPGSYDLEVRIFGHSNVLQPIVIGDEDVRIDVKTLRLY
jgi:hypothetical protein